MAIENKVDMGIDELKKEMTQISKRVTSLEGYL